MHRRRIHLILAGITLAANTAGLAQQPATAVRPVYRVALEMSAYPLVFAMVRVNGQEMRALVDTGSATPVRLSTRIARQLNLALAADPTSRVAGLDGRRLPVQRAQVETLVLGDWLERNISVEVAADRVEAISAQVGTVFDAILGWGLLSRHNFRLDYRQRNMQFSDDPLHATEKGVAVRYAVVNRLPVISARLGEHDVSLLVDTGAPMCNIDAQFVQLPAGQIIEQELAFGAARFALRWRVKDLSVTRQALGTAGTLGNNLLGRHVVYFDTRSQTMVLD